MPAESQNPETLPLSSGSDSCRYAHSAGQIVTLLKGCEANGKGTRLMIPPMLLTGSNDGNSLLLCKSQQLCRVSDAGQREPCDIHGGRRPKAARFDRSLRCRKTSVLEFGYPLWEEEGYLARFHATTEEPPADDAVTAYCNSSPLMVRVRFCSVPFQLGNVALSILNVIVLSPAFME